MKALLVFITPLLVLQGEIGTNMKEYARSNTKYGVQYDTRLQTPDCCTTSTGRMKMPLLGLSTNSPPHLVTSVAGGTAPPTNCSHSCSSVPNQLISINSTCISCIAQKPAKPANACRCLPTRRSRPQLPIHSLTCWAHTPWPPADNWYYANSQLTSHFLSSHSPTAPSPPRLLVSHPSSQSCPSTALPQHYHLSLIVLPFFSSS